MGVGTPPLETPPGVGFPHFRKPHFWTHAPEILYVNAHNDLIKDGRKKIELPPENYPSPDTLTPVG